jgi:predicted dehydrogenase
VLSPDNPERHEDLADLPLQSGKPVYIDKPIAPSLAAAQRLFAKAAQHGTPMMSSSALRFGSQLEHALQQMAGQPRNFCATRGGGLFHVYAIHQIEMLVMTLGIGATRVMQCGNGTVNHLVIEYPDNRRGTVTVMPGQPFQLSAQYGENQGLVIDTMDDFFPRFIDAMLAFFASGVSPIPVEETLEIAALIELGAAALQTPDTWVTRTV